MSSGGMQHSSYSPLNSSKSKYLYSFGKQQRFNNQSKSYCDKIYIVPTSKSKRSASIGYGNRFANMVNRSCAPSPQTYNLPSSKMVQSFTFGVSRDKFERVYIKENPPREKCVPGPSAYTPKLQYCEKTPAKYSLRPCTSYASMFNDPTKHFPGPGSYNGQTYSENKGGFYQSSRYRSPGNAVISRSGKRFDDNDTKRSSLVPGPGQYNQIPQKVWRNYGVAIIGSSKRSDLADPSMKKMPGPGQYRAQSDFGFYDANQSFSGVPNTAGSKH